MVRQAFQESLRLVRAAERLGALQEPIKTALSMTDGALEVAPELEPELEELKNRLLEIVEHILAANAVLAARMENLSDGV